MAGVLTSAMLLGSPLATEAKGQLQMMLAVNLV